jgi:hypothetical protein
MSIEFFRTENQRPLDGDGHELEPWLNPWFAIPEPTEADYKWAAANFELPPPDDGPSDEDWEDYARHCLDCERRDALRRMADTEYELRARFG